MSISIPKTLRALIILTFAQYIVPYDYIGISLATPKIREALHFSPALLPWILGGYVLTFGGFLILGGRLGDLYGRKRVLLIGLGIFAVCSLLTSLAQSPEVFLAFRFLKGIGSALLSPNALASMTVLYPEGRERNRAFGISSVFGGAFAIGFFLVAGNILAYGWPFLLLANLPLSLVIGYFVWRYVPESKSDRPITKFDFPGAVLSILSFGTLSFTVANSFRIGATSPITLGLLVLAVIFFAALYVAESRHPFPLVPLRLLKVRHLIGVYFVTFLWSAGNIHFPLNLFLQDVLKYTTQQASLAQMPTIVTGALVSLYAVRLFNRFGPVRVLYGALVTEIIGIDIYASLNEHSDYWTQLFPAAVVASSSFLVLWMAVRLLGATGIPNSDQGVASGAIYAMQQLGNSFGIPLLAAVLNAETLSQGPKTIEHSVYGFHWMFGTSIILVSIALIGGLVVIRSGAPSQKRAVVSPTEIPVGISPEPAGWSLSPKNLKTYMSKIIDWHSHWIPEHVLDLLSKRQAPPRVVRDTQGERVLLAQPWAKLEGSRALTREWHDIEIRLRRLDAAGVDQQLLSWPTTNQVDAFLPAEDARIIWASYNEELSRIVEKHNDRFLGVAMVPTSDIPWAARELERAHRELGLIGVVLPVGGFQTLEAAQLFAPIFEVAQKYRSHVYFHTGPANVAIPGQPINRPHPNNDAPLIRWSLDAGASFAAATVTLTQTGFLDPYPDVTVQLAMLGGSIPFLAEIIELRAEGLHSVAAIAKASPKERFRRVYFDSGVIGRGPRALELAVKAFGADRILFGTDFPPLPTLEATVKAFDEADLPEEKRELILSGNARRILDAKELLVTQLV